MHEKRMQVASMCGDGTKRTVETVRVSSPIGEMLIRVCSEGVHMIYQNKEITDENFIPDVAQQVSLLIDPPNNHQIKASLDKCIMWLKAYFDDVQSISNILVPNLCPIVPGSSQFRDRVLSCLAKSVAVGKTITYSELATLAGSPGAQQAVGNTMAANPFQLIIPCHRVVKSGQKVGKYSGGCRNSVKVWLLQHEGFNIDKDDIVSRPQQLEPRNI